MRMELLPALRQEMRMSQRQERECFACRQTIAPVVRIGAPDDDRIALSRQAGVCPACGTAVLADDEVLWAEIARRTRFLWSGKVAEVLAAASAPRLPLFRQGILGCSSGACPVRPKAPF